MSARRRVGSGHRRTRGGVGLPEPCRPAVVDGSADRRHRRRPMAGPVEPGGRRLRRTSAQGTHRRRRHRTHRHRRGTAPTWLQLNRLDGVERVRVSPLSLSGVRNVISNRLGRNFPRPTTVRIHEISGGNPFYALELARSMGDGSSSLADRAARRRCPTWCARGWTSSARRPSPCCWRPPASAPRRSTLLAEASRRDRRTRRRTPRGGREQRHRPDPWQPRPFQPSPAGARRLQRRRARPPQAHASHAGGDRRAARAAGAPPRAGRVQCGPLDAAGARHRSGLGVGAGRVRGCRRAARPRDQPRWRHAGPSNPLRRAPLSRRRVRTRRQAAQVRPWTRLPPGPLRASALNLLAAIRIYDDSLLEAIDLLDRALDDADGDRVLMVRSLLLSSFALLVLRQGGRRRSPGPRGAGARRRPLHAGADQPGARDVGAGEVHARRRRRRTRACSAHSNWRTSKRTSRSSSGPAP